MNVHNKIATKYSLYLGHLDMHMDRNVKHFNFFLCSVQTLDRSCESTLKILGKKYPTVLICSHNFEYICMYII